VRSTLAARPTQRSHWLLAVLIVAASALWCGGASARRGEPLRGPLALDAPAGRGHQVFATHRHACHPGGEAGLRPALDNEPLPGFLKRSQVRHGLGAMPAFSEAELDDAALDDLMRCLAQLRRQPAAPRPL
jgi:mono/diheme cytochrome c family protein